MRRMGQKTGTSKNEKSVIARPMTNDLVDAYLTAAARQEGKGTGLIAWGTPGPRQRRRAQPALLSPVLGGVCDAPELELGQPPDEWPELLVLLRRQLGALHFGVDLGRDEAQEQVEVVYAEAIGHDVEAVQEPDAQQVEQHGDRPADPSVHRVRDGLVQQVLEALLEHAHVVLDRPRQRGRCLRTRVHWWPRGRRALGRDEVQVPQAARPTELITVPRRSGGVRFD